MSSRQRSGAPNAQGLSPAPVPPERKGGFFGGQLYVGRKLLSSEMQRCSLECHRVVRKGPRSCMKPRRSEYQMRLITIIN